jgi:hypothetical protein
MNQDDIIKALTAYGNGQGQQRRTEYIRWTAGRFYMEVSVDAEGGMSYSTNLPPDRVGRGLSWPSADDRYHADLQKTLGEMFRLAKAIEEEEKDREADAVRELAAKAEE